MLINKNIRVLFIAISILCSTLSVAGILSWWVLFGVLFLWLIITSWAVFDIRSSYFISTYCKSNSNEKRIAITFDDGPSLFTIKVLEILRNYNAKATFFCIGTQIEKHPDIFNRIIEEGHLIGNHSYSHPKEFGFWSTQKVFDDIHKNDELIKGFLPHKPLFFRPPFGVTNPNIAKALTKLEHHVIGWNIRSLDTVIGSESKITKRITRKISPGGIVLFHDTSLKTVHVLEELLLFLQNQNYDVTPLDTLLNLKAYED